MTYFEIVVIALFITIALSAFLYLGGLTFALVVDDTPFLALLCILGMVLLLSLAIWVFQDVSVLRWVTYAPLRLLCALNR